MKTGDIFPKSSRELADKRRALAPEILTAWNNFSDTVFKAGALPE